MGVETFDWQARRKATPGSDPGPIKRGAGFSFMMFRAALGMSSAVVQVDAQQHYTLFVGVTDVGPGAKTTMGMIAAEALGTPLSQVTVVSGDTERCPYSVGESGSRTTIMTGMAVVEAVKDLQQQIAARGMPTGNDVLVASATPTPVPDGTMRQCFGRTLWKWKWMRAWARRIVKYVAVHESGRIINPQTARDQIGAVIQGIGQALTKTCYDPVAANLTVGYYRAASTHLGVPTIEVHFLEVDDGYGPFGAKTVGESGI